MIGDATDVLGRLRAVLPARWFPDTTPVLDAVLSGLAAGWSVIHDQLLAVRRQSRLATATGPFLDLAATDFFGTRLRRRTGQDDTTFRRGIQIELLRTRGTRSALVSVLEDLTGRTPAIFEPARPADTKGWNTASGWGVAGAWGSLSMPFQCLVTAFRPRGGGLSDAVGWGAPTGGWGNGSIYYASLSMVTSPATDADIRAAVAGVMPTCAIAWIRISN